LLSLFFVVLRAAEKQRKEVVVVAAPAGPTQEELLTQIRDLLKVISATLYILIYPEYISGLNRFVTERFSLKISLK
jgi:hypothetical protein